MKGGDDPTDLAAHKKRAETFGEPFKSASLWIPEGTPLYANFLSYWQPQPWDDKGGRITLVGDAAHPMTFRASFCPFSFLVLIKVERGQGMNHGIADAKVLTEQFTAAKDGKQTVAEALDNYQKEMLARAGEEVAMSIVNTEMLHDWSRFLNSPLMAKGGHANEKKD